MHFVQDDFATVCKEGLVFSIASGPQRSIAEIIFELFPGYFLLLLNPSPPWQGGEGNFGLKR
jgi:hypothetical protein